MFVVAGNNGTLIRWNDGLVSGPYVEALVEWARESSPMKLTATGPTISTETFPTDEAEALLVVCNYIDTLGGGIEEIVASPGIDIHFGGPEEAQY